MNLKFKQLGLFTLLLLISKSGFSAGSESKFVAISNKVPGESVANVAPHFMKHFQQSLMDYSLRVHQCSNPNVIDTKLMQYSPINTSQTIPVLTGPIHEQWKILACGHKFYYYVGIAPDDQQENELLFATVFKELDW